MRSCPIGAYFDHTLSMDISIFRMSVNDTLPLLSLSIDPPVRVELDLPFFDDMIAAQRAINSRSFAGVARGPSHE